MTEQGTASPETSARPLLWNLTRLTFEPRRLLQLTAAKEERREEAYFVDYVPPSRDAIALPRNILYVLVGVVLVVVATYAIVGHLIDDLMHDLADWMFGSKEVDVEVGVAQRASVYDDMVQLEEDRIKMEEERVGLLPGQHHHHRQKESCSLPAAPRLGAVAPVAGDRRTSAHSVTFACPLNPYLAAH